MVNYRDLSGNNRVGVDLDPDLSGGIPIRFASAPVSVFGRMLYPSVETFVIPAGERLEVDALLMNINGTTNAAGIWIGDGIKAVYMVREAAGLDFTLGRYSAGDASLGSFITTSALEGLNRIGLTVIPAAAATRAFGSVEGRVIPTSSFATTGNLINTGPVRIYTLTDDVINSRVTAKQY